jgi:ferric-dicitrate binding protein FerR (iron transport regulator)
MIHSELERLIAAWLDGRLSEAESETLQQQLRESADARQTFSRYAKLDAVLREVADAPSGLPLSPSAETAKAKPPAAFYVKSLLALAAALIVALSLSLYFQHANAEQKIARITGLSGSLVWTGDGGQIVRDLTVGTELSGGTIEGMAPDSWFELQFNDGSTVMISGDAMLTFSDFGQKELRLRDGRFSANVVPQPEGKPMLIHTRSAVLKVLGTQFEVEAGLASTMLHVSEGKVQLKRFSDGKTVDVPAKHRLVATADEDMSPQPVPDSVQDWNSQLSLGPEDKYGKWMPATAENPASLKAIPFVPQKNKSVTLYLLGFPVSRDDHSPVIVTPESRFVVRGRLDTASDVYFGIQVSKPNGEFAGKFLSRQLASQLADKSTFEAEFRLKDFVLDPCVYDRRDELPERPDDLVLTGVWSFTATGGPTGLEVTEVELIPATP